MNKPVSKALDEVIEKRKPVSAMGSEKDYVALIENEAEHYAHQVICPIISEGDAIGSVVIASKDEKNPMGDVEKKLAAAAAGFLGRQIEQ